MSITDMAGGRTARAHAKGFGLRRVPPAPARPATRPIVRPALQAAKKCLQGYWARVSGLLQAGAQILAPLPALLFNRLKSAALALKPRAARSHRALLRSNARATFLRVLTYISALAGLTATAFYFLFQATAQILTLLGASSLTWLKSAALAFKPSAARSHEAAVRALLRSDARATFLRLLTYISALAGLTATAVYFVRSTPMTEASDPAPAVEWLSVANPFPAFSLPLPELAESGYDYALRRHASGGGRQDILSWGELEGAAPHLMVEIYRPAAELTGFDDAEREIATRLAAIPADSIRPAGEMETKFGAVPLMEFSARPERQCLGFVRAYENPQLQILGWHCVSGSAPVERDLTACALDRLVLLAAGSEPKLRELFARAELKRNFCGQRSHLMTPTPKLGPAAPPPEAKRGRVALR